MREVQRQLVTFRGKVLDITHWLTFLVVAIYSRQVLSHNKGGSYDVAYYSCSSEPVKLK